MLENFADEAQLNRALQRLYRTCGYRPYKVSKFETYDFYMQNKPFLRSERILTFSDPGGTLMALKPDITLSIVKNAEEEKVYYTESVYRVPKNDTAFREIMQTGLECIGRIDVYAMSEVLRLAAESLGLISGSTVLDVSDLGILSGILEGCEPGVRQAVLEAFGAKNAHALHAAGLPAQTEQLLQTLLGQSGPLGPTLRRVSELPLPAGSRAALETLGEVAALLDDCPGINLDLSVVNDMEYYNGLVFRGFAEGVPAGVLSGGRYDGLMARMGKKGGALGFALYLDELERFYHRDAGCDFDTLILYDDGTDRETLRRTAQSARQNGRSALVQRSAPAALTFSQTVDLMGAKPCGRC